MTAQTKTSSGPDWWMDDEEFDRVFHDQGTPDGPPPPDIADETRAEDHLRSLAYWVQKDTEIRSHAQAEVDKIMAWEARELAITQRRIDWHELGLIAWLKAKGAKSIKLIGGTLKKVPGRDKVEIETPEIWCMQAAPEFVRIKREPDKIAIMAHFKSTGEIPDGCDLVTGEDTYKVVLPET